MKRASLHRVALVAVALVVQLSLAATVVAAPVPQAGNTRSDYIVLLKSNADPDRETFNAERSYGFVSRFVYRYAVKGFAASLTANQAAVIARLPFVDSVNLDGKVYAVGTGSVAGGETVPPGVKRVGGATSVITHTAASVAVAVIDTGVDTSHPDLNAVSGKDCIVNDNDARDENGHGTHVAGTIGAKNNGSGVIGVAPGTLIYAVRVLDANGSGSWSGVLCGIDWVTQNAASKNIKVANMSLGGGNTSYMRTGIRNSTNAGVTYVVAAGNNGANLANYSPANYTEVLTVTAISDTDGNGGAQSSPTTCGWNVADDSPASFSNYTTTTSSHVNHTIAGPGVCVYSTTMGGGYAGNWSGTSMASPHVAGAVALCVSVGGQCAGMSPPSVISTMRTLAQQHAAAGGWFNGDPSRPNGTRYYGYMAWVGDDLVAPTPDYSMSASPASRSISPGGATSFGVTITPSGGFNSAVALGTSGLPAGVTPAFTPASATTSSTLNLTTTTSVAPGTYPFQITGTGGGISRVAQATLIVNAPAAPDFSLATGASTSSVNPGSNASWNVTINRMNNFTDAVDLSASGLPSGATPSFSPDPTNGTSSTLTVTTLASLAPGNYPFTISGTNGTITRQTSATLVVNAPGSFTISLGPSSVSVRRGSTARYTVTISRTGGFSDAVQLSVSGLPTNSSGSFSPNPATGTSATLNVATNSSTQTGTRTITVTAVANGITRTATANISVTSCSFFFFC